MPKYLLYLISPLPDFTLTLENQKEQENTQENKINVKQEEKNMSEKDLMRENRYEQNLKGENRK